MATRGQSPCVVILGSPVESAGHIAPLLLVSSVTKINVVSVKLSIKFNITFLPKEGRCPVQFPRLIHPLLRIPLGCGQSSWPMGGDY